MYRASKKGKAHRSSAIETNALSSNISETSVIAAIMIIDPTLEGMVRRLVWKVSNPRLRRERVRYVCGGEIGMPNMRPLSMESVNLIDQWSDPAHAMYSGHKS